MSQLHFVLAVLFASCSAFPSDRKMRHDSSYMVSIFTTFAKTASVCGGSLISDRVVLTAAHCIVDESSGRRAMGVMVTVNQRNMKVFQVGSNVAAMAAHPLYRNGTNIHNDIAVLILKEPVQLCAYPDYSSPIELVLTARDSSTQALQEATGCNLKGLGQNEHGEMADSMKSIELNGNRWLKQGRAFIFVMPNKVKACEGDSGGPVVCRLPDGRRYQIGVAVGIQSRSDNRQPKCHEADLVIVVDLRRHLDFIKNVMIGSNICEMSALGFLCSLLAILGPLTLAHTVLHLPHHSIPSDPNHRMVLFGFRHGNRNPEKFLEENPRKWGYEGDTELTLFGKRQGFGLGREMRSFVKNLVRANFIPKEAKFYSSSANRCQMTLQSALAGFYPPQSFATWNAALDWTPVPYTIDDPLLRMYAVENCPASTKAWAPISDDTLPDLRQLIEDKKPILEYISNHTRWNASVSNAADLADNILEIDLYNATYPDWLDHPTLPGYTKETLKKEILAFGEAHQIECAEYEPCRDMMAGYWLQNIIDYLRKLLDKKPTHKLVGYASHTEITLAVMKLMYLTRGELTTSAGFVIEVREKSKDYQLRVLYHDPNPIDEHIIYQAEYAPELRNISSDDDWVTVSEFIALVEPKAFSDWETKCERSVAPPVFADGVPCRTLPMQEQKQNAPVSMGAAGHSLPPSAQRGHQQPTGNCSIKKPRASSSSSCVTNFARVIGRSKANVVITMLLRVALLVLVVFSSTAVANRGGLCSVYDPFKVLPENNKYQIGGAFPLHDTNCIWLLPDTVQDIVAIQWALTHWNQNPDHAQAKIGLYAGDTCSRPKEAISQSLRFLDSVGYHEPDECVQNRRFNGSQLLGLIAPKDRASSQALGTMLKTTTLPVAAYSEASVRTLVDLNVSNLISTTPTLGVFVEAFLKLMRSFRSNLVTIVDTGEDPETLRRVIDQLKTNDIFVAEIIPFDHPLLVRIIAESDSNVILSLVSKDQLFETFAQKELLTLSKLWVAIPLDGDGLSAEDQTKILSSGSRMQVISLQTKTKNLNQFKEYFIRVLKNNFQSYSLLTSYVQQVFNCSLVGTNGFPDCASLDKEHMVSLYTQSKTVDNVIRLTYALAVAGAKLEADKALRDICERPTENCTEAIMSQLETLDYTFGANDPAEFVGERIQFYRSVDNVLISSGIVIEGIELVNDEQMGPMVYKMLEYETGRKPRVQLSNLRAQDSRIRSVCAPYRPFCGQCEHIVSVEEEKYFLSIPKQYPLYVAGLFDLHEGEACQTLRRADISMPMAFVHTVWTFRQRFPQLNLLKNLDFGALISDACTSGKKAIELIVQSENHCFRFNQANRNITVVPGSTFGYISGVTGNGQEAVQRYFSSGHSEVPLVSVDGEHNTMMDTFTTFPSNRKQAIAVLKLLKKMQWEFVTVVLSEQDHDSLAAFHHFERLATDRGVCMAEVINISGENVPDTGDSSSHSTNVTVMFTTAKDAAMYLGNRLRRGDSSTGSTVHIMIGDAHDFHLHDTNNLGNYVGTVSVQPKDVLYSDFKHWLEMTTPLTLPEQWYWRHVEDRWQCALSLHNKHLYGDKMCNGDELLDVPSLGRMTKTGYLARGLERFLFAMDAVYKRLCPEQTGICVEFYTNGRKQILNILKKTPVEDDFEVYEFLPNEVRDTYGYRLIGNWSTTGGLRFSDTYHTFINGSPKSGFMHTSKCIPPLCKCFLDSDFFSNPLNAVLPFSEEPIVSGSYVRREPAGPVGTRIAYASVFEHITSGQWRAEPHNFVLLVFASVLLIAVIAVLILVCVKMYCKVVKGNQSLGITLLVGIGILYATSYFFIFDATDAICRCRIIFHSIGYTVCFGVMIAKASQLRNAETLGFANAIHISYWNYWMLLFFIVGVQIALSVRWISEPYLSSIELGTNSTRMICSFSHYEFLMAQSYVVILLILALFINSRNKNIKRNYKETKWLFLASLVCVLLWAFWVVLYLLAPPVYRDIIVILELLICGTVLLAFLFGPKIYILLSYEPVIVECQTQNFTTTNNTNEYGLFERDDDYHTRAVSPASSTDSGTRSTVCSGHNHGHPPNSGSSCGTCSDDQSPIFHTVMRKKNRIRRSHSEHEYNKNAATPATASPSPSPAVHSHVVHHSPRDSPVSGKHGVLQP